MAGRTPAITGTVVWSELGHPRHLIADATEVTRLRTGAIVGVATQLLAPAEARTCAIIGAGAQAADQIRAVHVVRPLTALEIVDLDPDRAQALADVVVGTDADKAVRDVDIVCCATTSTAPLFSVDSVAERAHVNAVGAFRPTMRELPDALPADATVVIDEREAALEEAGEVIHALEHDEITEDQLIELGAALTDGVPSSAGRTVFKTVGIATQDWEIARLLAQRYL